MLQHMHFIIHDYCHVLVKEYIMNVAVVMYEKNAQTFVLL